MFISSNPTSTAEHLALEADVTRHLALHGIIPEHSQD